MRENEGRWSVREKKNDFVLGRGETSWEEGVRLWSGERVSLS